jgi:IgGFc binding protein/Secretion system C-terminal sorting domain/SprB repeat
MKNNLKEKMALLKQFVLLGIFFLVCISIATAQNSQGKEFWICFPGNQQSLSTELYITAVKASVVTVEVPGIGFSEEVTVPSGGIQMVKLPGAVQVQSKFIAEKKGVHISATNKVTVYGMNAVTSSTDAFLAYPMDAIGKEYYVMAYSKDFSYALPSQATITATEDNTAIMIMSSLTDGGFTAGVPKNIHLNKGEVYQLRSNIDGADFTGTKIIADKPVSVFGGAQCTNISENGGRACDHLVEQMPAINTWGKKFITVPLATRLKGDVFRFLAQKDSTSVSVNGVVVANLEAGHFFETILNSGTYNSIISSQPILVGQYSRSSQADNVISDPFFALITPDEQYLSNYIVSAGTKNILNNYLNISASAAAIKDIKIDGVTIDTLLWKPVPGTGCFGAQVPVKTGVHNVSGKQPFGLLVYGFGLYDSYGYSGGQSFFPLPLVARLAILPKSESKKITNQQCFTATVKNNLNIPVIGASVDFVIIGVNGEAAVSSITDSAGNAVFCYTGTHPGTDKVKVMMAGESDDAVMSWADTCSITTAVTKVDPICFGASNGSVDLAVTNAAPPVAYLWSNGSKTEDLAGLKAGTYSVKVTDKNGCKDSLDVKLIDPPVIRTMNLITPNPTVAGQIRNTVYRGYGPQTVAVSIRVSGGVAPYTYNWGAYGNTKSVDVSPTNTTTYTCVVKDSRGCTKVCNITVNVVDVRCGTSNSQVLLCSKKPGTNITETICVDPSAVPGYLDQGAVLGPCVNMSRPLWNNSNGGTTEAVVVFPNPANNYLDVEWKMINNSNEVVLNVVDAKGLVVISAKAGSGYRRKLNISRLENGFYLLQIVGSNRSTLTSRFIVKK